MSRAICLVVLVGITGVLANPATQLSCPVGSHPYTDAMFKAFKHNFFKRIPRILLRIEPTQCEVSNLDITPCANKNKCLMKIGKNATINFDFIPEFSANELLTDVSWDHKSFQGLESNACLSTTCPVTAGVKHSFSYFLPLRKSNTAKGTFVIMWKLWNKADASQLCCFQTTIKLM